jgi:hypothetical protein
LANISAGANRQTRTVGSGLPAKIWLFGLKTPRSYNH